MALGERDIAAIEGLDSLEIEPPPGRSLLRRVAGKALPPLTALVAFLALWQLAVILRVKPDYVLPSPADVGRSLIEQWRSGHLLEAVWTSLRRGATGYMFSLVAGTLVGMAMSRVRPLRLALGSLLSGLQSLPSVTWVPVGILWFGLSETTIYFVVIMGAFPSIANGMLSAIDQTPPLLVQVGRSMGARGFALYRHVILPAALPVYLGGLKQGWAFSWRSLMAAELIAFSPDLGLGLGQLLDSGRALSDMSLVIASVLMILVVGIAVDACFFRPLERGAQRRRGLAKA